MGKLDVSVLRYLGSDEFRVLHAIETGMRNHEYVPTHLVSSLAGLQRGGSHKVLKELVRRKLVGYDNRKAEGYRLTVAGYDFMALRAMLKRDSLLSVGNQIGVGKESDIYIVANAEGVQHALKLHRLGRNSFRTIKKNRDYMKNRRHTSWLYMARLAAMKEYAYMKVLHEHGFPVPFPVDCDRNCIIMELLDASPLSRVNKIDKPEIVYHDLMELIVKLANHGLVHCDFNEFNLMISRIGKITMIDFPQMVSTDHLNAEFYFDRDVNCIRTYFAKRFGYKSSRYPKFKDVVRERTLDVEVAASGFSRDQQKELSEFQDLDENVEETVGSDDDSDSESDDDEDDIMETEETEVTEVTEDAVTRLSDNNNSEADAGLADLSIKDDIVVEVDISTRTDVENVANSANFVKVTPAVETSPQLPGDISQHTEDTLQGLSNDSEDDADGGLEDLKTSNRERRAFRDDVVANSKPTVVHAQPTKTEQEIKDKVRRAITTKSRRKTHKKEKGVVSREKKAKKNKQSVRNNIGW